MTNQQHLITPPPELVQQWADMIATHTDTEVFSAAAQWGADQELEACVSYVDNNISGNKARALRASRRPKPPSLKEQALAALEDGDTAHGASLTPAEMSIIRRALEQLDD
jgi:hypothetical protein